MDEQLSFDEAKRLSIIKWEAIVNANGNKCDLPEEVENLNGKCGFCERYNAQIGNYHKNCPQCEFGKSAGICFKTDSLFMRYSITDNNKLKAAKQILEIIKSLKSIHNEI